MEQIPRSPLTPVLPSGLLEFLRKRWLFILMLSGALWYATTWLFEKSSHLSSEGSAAHGIVLSVWGLVVSLVGFGITIWQLQRTKTAAVAVQVAVDGLLRRVQTSDLSVEAGRLIKFLEMAIVHVGHGSWVSGSQNLWEAQSLLTRIRDDLRLPEDKLALVEQSSNELLNYVQLLDSLGDKQAKNPNLTSMVRSLRVLINVLDQAIITYKKELYNA